MSAVDLYLSPVLVLGAALAHVAAYPTTDPVAGFSVGWAATIPETPHDMVHTLHESQGGVSPRGGT